MSMQLLPTFLDILLKKFKFFSELYSWKNFYSELMVAENKETIHQHNIKILMKKCISWKVIYHLYP